MRVEITKQADRFISILIIPVQNTPTSIWFNTRFDIRLIDNLLYVGNARSINHETLPISEGTVTLHAS